MYIIFVLYAIRTQICFNKKSQISWTPTKKNYEYLKSFLIYQYQTWFFIQSENGTHKLLAKAMRSVTSWLEISWAVKFIQDPKMLTKYNGIWLQWTIYHIYKKRKDSIHIYIENWDFSDVFAWIMTHFHDVYPKHFPTFTPNYPVCR